MSRDFARDLRKNPPDAERRLWHRLRHRQVGGHRWRRQAPIGPYIADFVCFELRLIVELDGGQHAERTERDAARTSWLNSRGFRVLRYWNHEIFEDLESILEAIVLALATAPPPRPSPARGEGDRTDASGGRGDQELARPLRGRGPDGIAEPASKIGRSVVKRRPAAPHHGEPTP